MRKSFTLSILIMGVLFLTNKANAAYSPFILIRESSHAPKTFVEAEIRDYAAQVLLQKKPDDPVNPSQIEALIPRASAEIVLKTVLLDWAKKSGEFRLIDDLFERTALLQDLQEGVKRGYTHEQAKFMAEERRMRELVRALFRSADEKSKKRFYSIHRPGQISRYYQEMLTEWSLEGRDAGFSRLEVAQKLLQKPELRAITQEPVYRFKTVWWMDRPLTTNDSIRIQALKSALQSVLASDARRGVVSYLENDFLLKIDELREELNVDTKRIEVLGQSIAQFDKGSPSYRELSVAIEIASSLVETSTSAADWSDAYNRIKKDLAILYETLERNFESTFITKEPKTPDRHLREALSKYLLPKEAISPAERSLRNYVIWWVGFFTSNRELAMLRELTLGNEKLSLDQIREKLHVIDPEIPTTSEELRLSDSRLFGITHLFFPQFMSESVLSQTPEVRFRVSQDPRGYRLMEWMEIETLKDAKILVFDEVNPLTLEKAKLQVELTRGRRDFLIQVLGVGPYVHVSLSHELEISNEASVEGLADFLMSHAAQNY